MRIAVYVIDTSYLLELFNIPGFSNFSSVDIIREKFKAAIQSKSRLYVPIPCIFELADQVAKVRDGRKRIELAKKLSCTVLSSIKESIPWNLIPLFDFDTITDLFKSYTKKYIIQSLGLTDTTVVNEANRLKKKYKSLNYSVHIWTKDQSMKSLEPDSEDHPFLG